MIGPGTGTSLVIGPEGGGEAARTGYKQQGRRRGREGSVGELAGLQGPEVRTAASASDRRRRRPPRMPPLDMDGTAAEEAGEAEPFASPGRLHARGRSTRGASGTWLTSPFSGTRYADLEQAPVPLQAVEEHPPPPPPPFPPTTAWSTSPATAATAIVGATPGSAAVAAAAVPTAPLVRLRQHSVSDDYVHMLEERRLARMHAQAQAGTGAGAGVEAGPRHQPSAVFEDLFAGTTPTPTPTPTPITGTAGTATELSAGAGTQGGMSVHHRRRSTGTRQFLTPLGVSSPRLYLSPAHRTVPLLEPQAEEGREEGWEGALGEAAEPEAGAAASAGGAAASSPPGRLPVPSPVRPAPQSPGGPRLAMKDAVAAQAQAQGLAQELEREQESERERDESVREEAATVAGILSAVTAAQFLAARTRERSATSLSSSALPSTALASTGAAPHHAGVSQAGGARVSTGSVGDVMAAVVPDAVVEQRVRQGLPAHPRPEPLGERMGDQHMGRHHDHYGMRRAGSPHAPPSMGSAGYEHGHVHAREHGPEHDLQEELSRSVVTSLTPSDRAQLLDAIAKRRHMFRLRMDVPGRVLHLVKINTVPSDVCSLACRACCPRSRWLADLLSTLFCCCFRRVRQVHEPRWSRRRNFDRMLVSTSMLSDHMPDVVTATLQQAVADVRNGAAFGLEDALPRGGGSSGWWGGGDGTDVGRGGGDAGGMSAADLEDELG